MGRHAERSVLMKNQTYDILRSVAQYWLPALGTLYFAVAQIWKLPYAEEVLGTITAIDIFLGTVLGISRQAYINSDAPYDGDLVVNIDDPNKDVYTLKLGVPFQDISGKQNINLKVTDDSQ